MVTATGMGGGCEGGKDGGAFGGAGFCRGGGGDARNVGEGGAGVRAEGCALVEGVVERGVGWALWWWGGRG